MEITLRGIGVSPGIAIGPSVTFRVQPIEVPRYTIESYDLELERFRGAVDGVRGRLQLLRDQTADELGEQHAAIFQSHLDMLDDEAFVPEIERRLLSEMVNVEYLVEDLISGYTKMLEQVDDPLFRDRSSDFVDIGRRVLTILLDRKVDSLEHLDMPCVVVADDLSPTETANMDLTNTLGLATDSGGPTSHMAILSRAFEIPAVVGLKYLGGQVLPGDTVIVDGSQGRVIVRPTESTTEEYELRREALEETRAALLRQVSEGVGVTLDGHEVPTLANIELPMETEMSVRAHCQGVGLYRTEFLFMNRHDLPSEEDQYLSYKQILESMNPNPVTIRTLDTGGDKVVAQLRLGPETNPQLGWRSIRFSLDRPDIFKAQLRALLRASVHGNLRIMFPLISGVDEYREAVTIVEEVKADLDARGVKFDSKVQIGSMIEVPSAVIIADRLAKECDFFSIGTNDLIQYCLAVDRVNERTAHLYQPAHPAVLRLLKQTITAAQKAEIPCSICGQMAGDPIYTELLLGLGFESLSMSAVSLPNVRAQIALTRMSTAKRFARKVLACATVSETNSLLKQRYESRTKTKRKRG